MSENKIAKKQGARTMRTYGLGPRHVSQRIGNSFASLSSTASSRCDEYIRVRARLRGMNDRGSSARCPVEKKKLVIMREAAAGRPGGGNSIEFQHHHQPADTAEVLYLGGRI